MNEEEYELWFDKDLKRDDFLEAENEDYENEKGLVSSYKF